MLTAARAASRSAKRLWTRYASDTAGKPSVNKDEIAKFASQAAKWWDPNGSAAPLHRMNPTRIAYIRSVIEKHIAPQPSPEATQRFSSTKPLAGIDVVDVGCGGGLVAEPMARLGANVLGIDMSKEGLAVAKDHATKDPYLASSARLQYREAAVEDLAASSSSFDVVLALEIIEHVAEPSRFIKDCASLVREGGVLLVSTLNRTVTSYALGIIAAERILRWLPPGTHDWSKFPRPDEVSHVIETETLLVPDALVGVTFNPLSGTFSIGDDTNVNYILSAKRPMAPISEAPSENASGT